LPGIAIGWTGENPLYGFDDSGAVNTTSWHLGDRTAATAGGLTGYNMHIQPLDNLYQN
jgi:hypothetical protein